MGGCLVDAKYPPESKASNDTVPLDHTVSFDHMSFVNPARLRDAFGPRLSIWR